jgi:hypothetical protein
MDKLEQKKLFVKRSFKLTDKGLRYEFKNLTSSLDLEIPYEEIGTKKIYQKLTNSNFLVLTIFMFFASTAKTYYFIIGEHDDLVFTLIVLAIFAVSGLFAYHGYKDYVLIEAINPPFIEFYSKRPDKDTVENFISELQRRTKNFLIKKYAERDNNIALETQLETISILKNRNIIDEKEYEELTNKLTKPKNNPIGFGS